MLSFLSTAVNIAIIWSGTTINVPLNDSLEPYKAIPEATLYMDGEIVNDPDMYYEYEVNHTRFSVVRTSAIGTYTVRYRVYFPNYYMNSTEMIKFVVAENEKPYLQVDDVQIHVGSKMPDLAQYATYYDNYDDLSELKLTIDSTTLNTNIVGTYPVKFKVTDKSNNETIVIKDIKVVDKIAPVIQAIKPIEVDFNTKFSYSDYFKVTDNYDQVLNVTYNDKNVNYAKPGIYEIEVIAKDQSLNTTTKTATISIIDTSEPSLRLKYKEISINYLQNLTIDELRNYIVDVKDNLTNLDKDNVVITSYVDSSILGTYEVTYEAIDEVGMITTEILKVHVKDKTKPKLTIIKPLTLVLNTIEPYVQEYIYVSDNYDLSEDIVVKTNGKIDMTKIGQYRVLVSLTDTSKNEVTYPLIFTVVDLESPTINQIKDINIENFIKPSLASFFNIKDNYHTELIVTFDDSKVNYNQTGKYELTVYAMDYSGNQSKLITYINVLDTESPEIILTTKEVFISFDKSFNLKDYIDQITDNHDKDLSKEDIIITSNIIEGVLGRYTVTYELNDKSGNKTTESMSFVIGDYISPSIKVDYIEINKGDYFDYKKYVTATDNYDGDISNMVNFSPNYIPTQTPGTYEAIFYVHDSAGNYAEQKVIITVSDAPKTADYVIYITIGVVVTSILAGYYFFSKRKVKF